MIVPRAVGDIEHGHQVYEKNCAICHGKTANGIGEISMPVGQYSNYLNKQIEAYLGHERPHDEDILKEGVLHSLSAKDIQDVLAYLTAIQVRK